MIFIAIYFESLGLCVLAVLKEDSLHMDYERAAHGIEDARDWATVQYVLVI
jgi:hypothetical protein